MEGFLTFIFFLVLGFYVLGFLLRLALRLYIKRLQKRFGGTENGMPNGAFFHQFNFGFGGNQSQQNNFNQRKEGDVTITSAKEEAAAKGDKKINKDTGDYVDFEEIK